MKKSAVGTKTTKPVSQAQGILIVLSAPSGCGKTTIVDRLLKRNPDWMRSISATTRTPRTGEKDGQDYFFVSAARFAEMESKGELLESAKVFDEAYGTPKKFVRDELAAGKKIVLAIDVQGTRKIKKTWDAKWPLLTIFILPPSVKVLRERLEGRKTETPDQIQKRIEVAQDEIKEAAAYDLTLVNQNLEETIAEIEAAIEKFEKQKNPSSSSRGG